MLQPHRDARSSSEAKRILGDEDRLSILERAHAVYSHRPASRGISVEGVLHIRAVLRKRVNEPDRLATLSSARRRDLNLETCKNEVSVRTAAEPAVGQARVHQRLETNRRDPGLIGLGRHHIAVLRRNLSLRHY